MIIGSPELLTRPGFQGLRFQVSVGFRGFRGFRVLGVLGFEGFRVLGFEGFRVLGFEGFRVLGFEGFRVLGFEGLELGLQWVYDSGLGEVASKGLRTGIGAIWFLRVVGPSRRVLCFDVSGHRCESKSQACMRMLPGDGTTISQQAPLQEVVCRGDCDCTAAGLMP